MLETVIITAVGWMLLAASAFRFRRDLAITNPSTVRVLRIAAGAVLAAALMRCGAPVTGERIVRFLGGSSLSAVVMVMTLSIAPMTALRPVAVLLALARSIRQSQSSARSVQPRTASFR